jgi:hypothetical protein
MSKVAIFDLATKRVFATRTAAITGNPDPGTGQVGIAETVRDDQVLGYTYDGSKFVPPPALSAAEVEDALLDGIDQIRESKQMAMLSAGGAKKYIYAQKALEAADAKTLLVATLNALSLVDRQKRFPFAQAEATLTGEAVTVVLARFDSGIAGSRAEVARLEAVAQKAKRAIKAATTAAAKRAAFDAVKWTA